MTLVVSWIKHEGSSEELLIASDSRISGGTSLDQAPKLLRLLRDDAVLAFCGTTRVAYPIVIQIKLALDAYEPARKRLIDIVDLPAHLRRIIESMRQTVADLPDGSDEPIAFKIMLAGFSWRTSSFKSWVLKFDLRNGEFTAHPMRPHRVGGRIVYAQFMSDVVDNEHRARSFLDKTSRMGKGTSWTPFDALMEQIGDPEVKDVGGPPQLVKIYRHANTLPVNTIWPFMEFRDGEILSRYHVTHFGRALLPYERTDYLSLDLRTSSLIEPWNVQAYIRTLNETELESFRTRLRIAALRRVASAVAQVARRKLRQEIATDMVRRGCDLGQINLAMSCW